MITAEVVTTAAAARVGSLSSIDDRDLEQLLTIRAFEERLLSLFAEGKLNGTTHTCLGQEYVPVALRPLLRDGDFVFSNHRGHGHYLARFDDPEGLLAEIMGRDGAVCRGVGGSQHIFRRGYLSTGVQGESMPVACGVALTMKRRGGGQLAVVHLGDGTWGEGSVYEALNIAQLWGLPLVVVVEHNGIAQTTPTELQMAGTIEGRARAFGVAYELVETVDVMAIREHLAPAVHAARTLPRPLVVEVRTQRLGPHSKGDDSRDLQTIAVARERDWYPRYRQLDPQRFDRIEAQARRRLDRLVEEVGARPLSSWTGVPTDGPRPQ